MNKKIIAAVVAASFVIGQGAVVFAEPVTQEQIQQSRDQYNAIEDKIAGLEEQLNILDEQIGSMNQAIEKNNQEIAALQKQVEDTQKAIEKLKGELKEKQDLFDSRMRAIYKSGGQNAYISLLVEAKGFSDFIARAQAVGKLMGMDQKIIKDLNDKKQELDDKVKELDGKVLEVGVLKQQNEAKLAELKGKVDEQNKVIAEAKAERAKVEVDLDTREWTVVEFPISVINNDASGENDIRNSLTTLVSIRKNIVSTNIDQRVNAAVEKAKSKLDAIQAAREAANRPLSRGDESASASAVSLLNYAYQFQGIPYVYGGTTPSGFDCSGFTQYVFRKFGISIGRTTYNQIGAGRAVSQSQMQPGDLVFTHAGHVGIYVGNGNFIHAPHTGDKVKVSKVYKFYAARRILN
ncbi:Cell wall-associated hydrolase, NlpC family [Clostridium amylolyticum]|uniref:Cell wall-associated hydrolase, NlpC family n=1 Tax=Clostridium amylolyticum TaxID=1121298 RepID=A0A1M6MA70_9CLOT|nr:C40 family peptidase [Clostridium amylolyticum]SHJ80385.1 Cell wall-associated hydrolase, NlpC family [Clostridium amylolyticum]